MTDTFWSFNLSRGFARLHTCAFTTYVISMLLIIAKYADDSTIYCTNINQNWVLQDLKKESNSEIKYEQGLRHCGREDEAMGGGGVGEGRGTPLFSRAKLFSFIKSEQMKKATDNVKGRKSAAKKAISLTQFVHVLSSATQSFLLFFS